MSASDFFRRLAAVLFGLTLLFGGVLKLMDPVGAQLVMESYLRFCRLGWLSFASGALTLFFNLLECFVGAAMIAGAWTRWIRWIALGLMSLFTLLTALLLIFNPAMDCGCFGEIVHLTHLQSFLKNVVLLLLWVAAFVPTNKVRPQHVRRRVLVSVAFAGVAAFAVYGYTHLPLLDLTDLRAGTELSEGSVSLLGDDGDYHDDLLLEGDVLLVSVYDPSSLSRHDRDRIARTFAEASASGLTPLLASVGPLPEGVAEWSSGDSDSAGYSVGGSSADSGSAGSSVASVYSSAAGSSATSDYSSDAGSFLGFYLADRKTLLSLNRSNGGATYISDGQVVAKWTAGKARQSDFDQALRSDPTDLVSAGIVTGRFAVFGYLLLTVVFLLI